MNKNVLLIFLLAIILAEISCNNAAKDKKDKVSRFSWLNGNWVMKDENGTTTEQWKIINDSLMTGKSDFVKGDSIIPFETIKIYTKDTLLIYQAKAAGQNDELPVDFIITSLTDSAFVAENPTHDFPKRISYNLINKDSIHAYIDGGAAMKDKRADFYYSREKNK